VYRENDGVSVLFWSRGVVLGGGDLEVVCMHTNVGESSPGVDRFGRAMMGHRRLGSPRVVGDGGGPDAVTRLGMKDAVRQESKEVDEI